MNNTPYTNQEMNGKYIVCFPLLSSSPPCLDTVRYAEGLHEGRPYLYNSVEEGRNDLYFDADVDIVIEASEYFKHISDEKAYKKFKF